MAVILTIGVSATSHHFMATPQLFLDFEKNPPVSAAIVIPNGATPEDAAKPEVKQALEAFLDQNLNSKSLSTKILHATKWACLERSFDMLPGDDQKDVSKISWFVGNYDWEHLVSEAVELGETMEKEIEIYLVPMLGQSAQGSDRVELTYNAFVTPKGVPPFSYLTERLPMEESPDVDVELYKASDPASYVPLTDLRLEWADIMKFTKEEFEFLEDKKIEVKILRPTKDFQTSFAKFYSEDKEKFQVWYDTAMSNFMPLIPGPMTEDGHMATGWPSFVLQPIECTPPSYKKLLALWGQLAEKVGKPCDLLKYWQFGPADLEKPAADFAKEMAIPKNSVVFNNLFFHQYELVRQSICEDILKDFLNIMRPDDEIDMWRGAPEDIDKELERWDGRVKMMLMYQKNKDELAPLFAELKEEVSKWFTKDNARDRYNEFKETITEVLTKLLSTPSFAEYLKIFKAENETAERRQWLELYDQSKTLFCLWPTIYSVVPARNGEENPMLAQAEKEHLLHLHMSIPATRGHTLPSK